MSRDTFVGSKFNSGSLEDLTWKVNQSSLKKPFTDFRYIVFGSPQLRELDYKP